MLTQAPYDDRIVLTDTRDNERMKWRWLLSEYLLKGLYLGLACEAALSASSYKDAGLLALGSLIIPVLGILTSTLWQKATRVSGQGAWFARIILAIIDHPLLIHVGTPVGMLATILYLGWPLSSTLLAAFLGLLAGGGLYLLVALRRRALRRGAMTVALIAALGVVILLVSSGRFIPAGSGSVTALSLAISAAVLYLLTFSGRSEETELDIGLICLFLSLALGSLDTAPTIRSIVLLGPVGLYVVYCERMRRQFVVFKHIVRAMDHERKEKWKDALIGYRLALQTDPKSELATAGSWRVHRHFDPSQVAAQEDILSLIDPEACLSRATALITTSSPSKEHLAEARQLLDIVDRRLPDRHWVTEVRRIDALLAEGNIDDARLRSRSVATIDPRTLATLPPSEVQGIFQLWAKLLQNPVLLGTGTALIDQEGASLDFIAVIEEQLTRTLGDTTARDFKTFLYRKVEQASYERFKRTWGSEGLARFDYRFCKNVANELAGESPDKAVELFMVSCDGLADERLSLLFRVAQIHESTDHAKSINEYRQIRDDGRAQGVSSLSRADREAFDESARRLAQEAESTGDASEAIANWEIYAGSDRSGMATRRRLQSLYESQGDRLLAIRHLQGALTYDTTEPERKKLVADRTRLYHEVTPDELRPRLTEVERFFDFEYCYRRALQLFDEKATDDEVTHYIQLAELGGSKQLRLVNFLLGRLHLRQGDERSAAMCLEQTRANPPKQFRNDEEKQAYFRACRLLGQLYVDKLGEPEKAIECLSIYKDHLDSGADTLFLLARAYEGAGQIKAARKWYDMVLVYPSHPKANAAKEALSRLTGS